MMPLIRIDLSSGVCLAVKSILLSYSAIVRENGADCNTMLQSDCFNRQRLPTE